MILPFKNKPKDEPVSIPVTKVPERKLTVQDRCDVGRCGAQAYVAVVVCSVKRHLLLFCGHHYRAHEPALLIEGYRVVDERAYINAEGV